MCKRDDIKCEICSSKLCVSWCCVAGLQPFFPIFHMYIYISTFLISRNSISVRCLSRKRTNERTGWKPEKCGKKKSTKTSSTGNRAKFGKCVFAGLLRVYAAGTDRRFGLRQNITLFKLWKVIYYSDHNKREFPSFRLFFFLLSCIFFRTLRSVCVLSRKHFSRSSRCIKFWIFHRPLIYIHNLCVR